ncbi:MAG TPA: glycoside hydrolase family 2 TIM barrel-domain containing protein [Chthoniobacteraceae bacterium]|nr:glycoside hydrolase family 2 TIM barrel-domain containing protein [Chthoniobacteraceae bacterium]
MKFRFPFVFALVLTILPLSHGFAQREVVDLTDGWKFTKQDAKPDAAYKSWESVTVPHTWNAKDGQEYDKNKEKGKGYYRGPAWYAKDLEIPAKWKGKRVFIRFEAASLVADVYINGKQVGEHRGGFAAFCYEITPYLKPGGKNVLRVKVDNTRFDDIAPLSGDFTVFGGLYRPVHLIVTGEACITPLDYASPGVFLTGKNVTADKAEVEVLTEVSGGKGDLTTQVDLLDANKKVVQTVEGKVGEGESTTPPDFTASTVTLTIPQPHLWNGRKDPYLYQVHVKLLSGGKVIDEVDQNLGLRTAEIVQDKGFLLNGAPYALHGVNRHQEVKDKGWAISNADHDRDFQLIYDLGATVVRLAHYQQSNYVHDICDHNGIVLWQEIPLVNQIYGGDAFANNAKQQLTEMIKQGYNHPSICMWGLYNEMGAKWIDDPKSVPADDLLKDLHTLAKKLDSMRIIVAASQVVENIPMHYIPDWQGYNIYPGWYDGWGTVQDFGTVADKAFNVNGGKMVAISEYGAGANIHQHDEHPISEMQQPVPTGQFHPEEWQDYLHETAWSQFKDNPHIWGTFVWAMFDFAVSGRNEGDQPGTNDKGLVTHDRSVKKDAYFFYQANWTDKPMVYIASRRMTPRKEANTYVKIYSNCDQVDLMVNGRGQPAVKGNDVHVFLFPDVTLKPGNNTIQVTGHSGQKNVSDKCEWVLEK